MTENEAIEVLKEYDECAGCMVHIDHYTCIKAIQALEEVQQYRAIGTVERFEQLSKQFAPHNVDETSCHLRQCNKCDMYRKENEKYHAIGTIEDFKALKEKNEPKKMLHNGANWYRCSNGCEIHKKQFEKDWYCPKCGQKLDWSE